MPTTILVGTDRVAANGDVANKIGTYGVAVLAREHGIPFYVAAPLSTVDPEMATGDGIPIEERGREEVAEFGARPVVPEGVPVRHPAFDVTPAALVDAIVTEHGIVERPEGRLLCRGLAEMRQVARKLDIEAVTTSEVLVHRV